MSDATLSLAERLLSGDVRALARGISQVENNVDGYQALLGAIYGHTGRAMTVGVTGFAGTGKSSLVDAMTHEYRRRERTVGIVAVDPSSAFSGGAILGDRIRMQRHTMDSGVYVRSMASRGHLGGLGKSTIDAIDLVDASGKEVVVVETVGVGQDEIDVVRAADTVLVVLVPGLGDDIQAIKAGILEIADIFVINKSDREGADRLEAELRAMISLGEGPPESHPQIVRTVAIEGLGIDTLVDAIDEHRQRPQFSEARTRRQEAQGRDRFLRLMAESLLERVRDGYLGEAELGELVGRMVARELDPYSAVEQVLGRLSVRRNDAG